jgi:hypothetical protein
VESHHGKIYEDSIVDKKATFTIELNSEKIKEEVKKIKWMIENI